MPTQQAKAQQVKMTSIERGVEGLAEIRNVSTHAIKVSTPTWFPCGDLVEIQLAEGFKEAGRIVYCKRDGERFEAVVGLNAAGDNRKEARHDASQAVLITEFGKSPVSTLEATVVNQSKSGFGLLMKKSLEVGSLVSVTFPDAIIIGEVRHCAPDEQDRKFFRIGLSIERETLRSAEPPAKVEKQQTTWLGGVRNRLFPPKTNK